MWPNIQPAQLTHQLGVKAQAISIGFNEFGYRQWLEQWVKYLMLSFVWYDSIMDSNQLKVSVFLLGRYPCFYINNFNQFNRIEIWFYWLIILVLISHDWFRDGFKPIVWFYWLAHYPCFVTSCPRCDDSSFVGLRSLETCSWCTAMPCSERMNLW